MAKPYGLANQKLSCIHTYKSRRKRQRIFRELLVNTEPDYLLLESVDRKWLFVWGFFKSFWM